MRNETDSRFFAAPRALPARAPARPRLDPRHLPFMVTLGLFGVMFGAGSIAFDGFFSLQVFLNLFIDNAFLLIAAVGMTFVIISGGIDLSVGSVTALTTMVLAHLVENRGWSPALVIPLVLLMGATIGLIHGFVIQYFSLQPFIVTLAGMFLARGSATSSASTRSPSPIPSSPTSPRSAIPCPSRPPSPSMSSWRWGSCSERCTGALHAPGADAVCHWWQ
ncbi:ABC transporter permease subunit [Cystobacter fuscus]